MLNWGAEATRLTKGKEQKQLNSLRKTGERGRQSIPLCVIEERKKALNCL